METLSVILNANWHILGASVTGTSHHKDARGCDDNHAYRQLSDGTLLAAVADGAGSASRAAEGAANVVHAALTAAEAVLFQQTEPSDEKQWSEALNIALKTARLSLEQLAAEKIISSDKVAADETPGAPLPLREFATTLLITIVTPQWVAAAQIGDGAIVVQPANGILQALTKPDHGEYINETNFITDSGYLEHVQCIALREEIQAVALLSDGLQMLALDVATHQPFEPFFIPLFRFASKADATEAALIAFLESERVCARTDDDKTLVLAVRL